MRKRRNTFFASEVPPLYRWLSAHTPVEVHAVEDLLYVREIDAFSLHVQRLLRDLRRCQPDQEVVEVFLDLRPERPRRVLLLIRGELDGHDHVGLDLYDEASRLTGDLLAPLLLLTQVTAVRDYERGVFASVECHLFGEPSRTTILMPRFSRASCTSFKPSSMKV